MFTHFLCLLVHGSRGARVRINLRRFTPKKGLCLKSQAAHPTHLPQPGRGGPAGPQEEHADGGGDAHRGKDHVALVYFAQLSEKMEPKPSGRGAQRLHDDSSKIQNSSNNQNSYKIILKVNCNGKTPFKRKGKRKTE